MKLTNAEIEEIIKRGNSNVVSVIIEEVTHVTTILRNDRNEGGRRKVYEAEQRVIHADERTFEFSAKSERLFRSETD